MKEFYFLCKELGFRDALFYLFYKAELKAGLNERNKRRHIRVSRIYSALPLLHEQTIVVKGDRYIKRNVPGSDTAFVYLRPYSSDLKVFEQVFIHEEYKSVLEIYAQFFPGNPEYIVDCGANIGLTGIYFSNRYKPASLIAAEPFKKNTALLKLNFENNHITDYVLIEGGVWNKNTRLVVNRSFRDGKEWSVNLKEDAGGDITGYSLTELISNAEVIDILKIDIEGAEQILFSDKECAGTFLSKTRCIAIEIHDEFNIRDIIYTTLKENGFFYFNTGELTIGINRSFT